MRQQAFTLIELSIVLVIIGLIVGGILVGRDLIKAAAIRSQIAQVEQIETAALTFKLKYNGIPGDIKNATSFFSNVSNGNGNGMICSTGTPGIPITCYEAQTNSAFLWVAGAGLESSSVFDHLAAAGLINMEQYDETANASAAIGIGYPAMKFQGSGVQDSTAYGSKGGIVITYLKSYLYLSEGNKIIMGACAGSGGYVNFFCGMNAPEAFQLDSKFDDGLPFTGKVRVVSEHNYLYRVPGDANDSIGTHCTITHSASDNQYNVNYNLSNVNNRRCAPAVNAAF